MPHLCGSMRPRRVFGAARFKAKRSMTWSALFCSMSWLHPCSHGNSMSWKGQRTAHSSYRMNRAQHIPLVPYNKESEEQELPFLPMVALMQSVGQPAALVLLCSSPLLLSCCPLPALLHAEHPSKGGKTRQI